MDDLLQSFQVIHFCISFHYLLEIKKQSRFYSPIKKKKKQKKNRYSKKPSILSQVYCHMRSRI